MASPLPGQCTMAPRRSKSLAARRLCSPRSADAGRPPRSPPSSSPAAPRLARGHSQYGPASQRLSVCLTNNKDTTAPLWVSGLEARLRNYLLLLAAERHKPMTQLSLLLSKAHDALQKTGE